MVTSHHVNTFSLPENTAREIWCEITDGTYVLDEHASIGYRYRFYNKIWLSEDILFAKVKSANNTIIRTSEINTHYPAPILKIKLFKRGSSIINMGTQKFYLGCNAIHFIDHNRPMCETYSNHELLSIFLPHHAIGYDQSTFPAVFSLELESALGRLLEASINTAFQQIEVMGEYEVSAFAKVIAGILRSTLTTATNNEQYTNVYSAQSPPIKRFIDQNLDDSSLGIDLILNTFRISRATLFRKFADVGGVDRYILYRRLHRAYRDLSEAQPERGAVKAVAERWGFSSQAHFSRVFKRQFLVSPASLVGRWALELHDTAAKDNAHGRGNLSSNVAALKWAYARYR